MRPNLLPIGKSEFFPYSFLWVNISNGKRGCPQPYTAATAKFGEAPREVRWSSTDSKDLIVPPFHLSRSLNCQSAMNVSLEMSPETGEGLANIFMKDYFSIPKQRKLGKLLQPIAVLLRSTLSMKQMIKAILLRLVCEREVIKNSSLFSFCHTPSPHPNRPSIFMRFQFT